MTKKNCMIAQSGGPTSAINASIAGIISAVTESGCYDKIYGAIHGVSGLKNEKFIELSENFSDKANLEALKISPAMYLGSCRVRLPEYNDDPDSYEQMFSVFEKMNIGAFFYVGGNDSMDTAAKLSAYAKSIGSDVRIIGVPKTIDNDLFETDHTPGFGSAAKYIATTMREIAYDTAIYDLRQCTIVEVMGRDTGWLTAATALARNEFDDAPQLIYLPESTFTAEKFLEDVENRLKIRKNVVVAIAEGVKRPDGKYVNASEGIVDAFGHGQLAGISKALENFVKEEIGIKSRSIEVNIPQRCAGHISSKTDLDESFELGRFSVSLAADGMSGKMAGVKRVSNKPYKAEFRAVDVSTVANKVKKVPRNWINERGNDITPEFIDYLSPLIQGEVNVPYENGLPVYANIEHLMGRLG